MEEPTDSDDLIDQLTNYVKQRIPDRCRLTTRCDMLLNHIWQFENKQGTLIECVVILEEATLTTIWHNITNRYDIANPAFPDNLLTFINDRLLRQS